MKKLFLLCITMFVFHSTKPTKNRGKKRNYHEFNMPCVASNLRCFADDNPCKIIDVLKRLTCIEEKKCYLKNYENILFDSEVPKNLVVKVLNLKGISAEIIIDHIPNHLIQKMKCEAGKQYKENEKIKEIYPLLQKRIDFLEEQQNKKQEYISHK